MTNLKNGIFTGIYHEAAVPAKKSISSVHNQNFNTLEQSDHKYQTNGNIIYEIYKGNLIFIMNNFCYLEQTVNQCFLMPNILFKR